MSNTGSVKTLFLSVRDYLRSVAGQNGTFLSRVGPTNIRIGHVLSKNWNSFPLITIESGNFGIDSTQPGQAYYNGLKIAVSVYVQKSDIEDAYSDMLDLTFNGLHPALFSKIGYSDGAANVEIAWKVGNCQNSSVAWGNGFLAGSIIGGDISRVLDTGVVTL